MVNSNNPNRPTARPRSFPFAAYWFNLIGQPALAIVFIVGLAWLFGYLQRNHNWFNHVESSALNATQVENAQYACSMLCVFVKAPGRCPVCGMELQKIETQGDPKDLYGVTIDPTARRLANIETVAALNLPTTNEIEALGQITYNESTKAMVSAYVDGRIEKLLVDYTGAKIRQGDQLAILYSPDLYADQVGLLQAKTAMREISENARVNQANARLYESARRRLIESGLPESQVDQIESEGNPSRRLKVFAPVSGTVVEKLVEDGTYIQTGMPLFKIADLSSVWLMLKLYPEDAVNLKIGQTVSIEIRSQIANVFAGKISFIDPMVDPENQTVDVRVEIPNEAGLIKIGDFGKAIIQSVNSYGPMVVVPREAVLINGANSIAYVETEPGRFEFRKVKIAEIMGDKISIAEGIRPGEQVVASGAFMLDSTFNLQGKVSLIDPNRVAPKDEAQIAKEIAESKEIEQSFADLSSADRQLAETQIICPVSDVKLGTMGMGTPINVEVNGTPIMICCEGCRDALLENPQKFIQVLEDYQNSQPVKNDEQPPVSKSSTSENSR